LKPLCLVVVFASLGFLWLIKQQVSSVMTGPTIAVIHLTVDDRDSAHRTIPPIERMVELGAPTSLRFGQLPASFLVAQESKRT
jgi:hypothetical protein